MSKITELIEGYCPDGVEYKPLRAVIGAIPRGRRLTKEQLAPKGIVPVYHGGLEPIGYHSHANTAGATVMIINTGASSGSVGWSDSSFWCSDGCFALPHSDLLLARYLYYFAVENEKYFVERVRKAGIPTLTADSITSIEIPIPPLPIQEEIVSILDAFTELTTELTTELSLREKQYEYYRDTLIQMFDDNGNPVPVLADLLAVEGISCPGDVEWMRLGEVAQTVSGLIGKNKTHFTGGNARFVSYMNAFSNIAVDQARDDFVVMKQGERQNQMRLGDVVITGSSETLDEVGMSSVVDVEPRETLLLNSFCFALRFNDAHMYLPAYSKYLFRSRAFRDQVHRFANGVTRINVSKSKLLEVRMPVPALPVQRRIAEILDDFSALTTSLTEGLPAEIALRTKQYKYYRNKLLTFTRAPSSSYGDGVVR